MITVVKNPEGHKILDTPYEGEIGSGAGYANITSVGHGLQTGDWIYVVSDIDEYNGFWYVTFFDANIFRIREHSGADYVEHYQDLTITWYKTEPHQWVSIYLPIVYKILNDRWPVNSVDTVRNISSTADDNGFLDITASGVIKDWMNILEYVKIEDSPVEGYNGVWQIMEVVSNSRVVIDAPYTAESLAGATIQYYYNNYQVKVKIFSGLPDSHPWEEKKPYEEVAELSLTPDENNQVMFSVADYIRGKVAIKNNTTHFAQPLNLDAFTGFYISTAESFDDSDNYTITENESEFTDDDYEGFAIAGKLPFRNTYAGEFSDYVVVPTSPARWLTNMVRLLAIEDSYFDVSFIKNVRGPITIFIDKYISDYRVDTEEIEYDDQGIGVYRIPITPEGEYDYFCIRAYTEGAGPSGGGPPVTSLADLEDWINATGSNPGSWTLGSAPNTSVNGDGGTEGYIAGPMLTENSYEYDFTANFEIAGSFGGVSVDIIISLLDSSFNEIDSVTFNYTDHGVYEEDFTLTSLLNDGAYVGMRVVNDTALNTKTIIINSFVYHAPDIVDDSVPAQDLTEEICMDILSCEVRTAIEIEEFRLLEDGEFRLLEDGASFRKLQ